MHTCVYMHTHIYIYIFTYIHMHIYLHIHCCRAETQYCTAKWISHTHTYSPQINSKWIKDLNVKSDTKNFLDQNTGRILFDINCSKVFFDPSPRVMKIKTKVNKCDPMKPQNFCIAKETINKSKRQSSEWGKYLPTQQLTGINLQNIQTAQEAQYQKDNPIKKWAEDINRNFSKDLQDGQQTYEKMLNITNYKEKCNSKLQRGIISHWP